MADGKAGCPCINCLLIGGKNDTGLIAERSECRLTTVSRDMQGLLIKYDELMPCFVGNIQLSVSFFAHLDMQLKM